ncbi:hypothetical protein H0W26_02350 [Candidatus Dependentiae bacterium]|nr:hypothetical protein [Candidatus Dependentiae bacterium]
MKFENLRGSSDESFRGITLVKRTTFNAMIKILENALIIKKAEEGLIN